MVHSFFSVMKNLLLFPVFCLFVLFEGFSQKSVYRTETLEIIQLTESSFVHVSFLSTNDFGRVACNGLVVLDGGEAFVLDTPVDDQSAEELLQWIKSEKGATPTGILATHFHNDCLGGLKAFHTQGIPSFASQATVDLAEDNGYEVPKRAFFEEKVIRVGGKTIEVAFLGEGHTRDNVVGLVKEEKVLFGGCLIKELGATKGYLGDANLDEWSKTVKKLKQRFPGNQWVIPGHGKPGGDELLDYTAALFGREL
jgi:metallo-beta-lactamase class B